MEQKAVIILCDDLPNGLKANIAAVLGMSLNDTNPIWLVRSADGENLRHYPELRQFRCQF